MHDGSAAPIAFDNSYARLPERFHAKLPPTPVAQPRLIAVNDGLARELGIDPAWLRSDDGVQMLAGNRLAPGSEPLAQAYAGHQFGGWVPQLGDGRAILLGEVIDQKGERRDIQLKGAGRTPFSRMGDGRAWLGPVLREYIVSEAMHALGIPTTRALAAVTTGEPVYRETSLPGAILTRVAASHLRVGTFQYFAARGDVEALETLTLHALARHYPQAEGDNPALVLLNQVIAAQARLVADWMGVGFIHGVMNTDNMTISGETIDYGPCAFMDGYDPNQVFSSIDQMGRYAYSNQPRLAHWNLAQLASALLPLIDADQERAIAVATEAIERFPDLYTRAWQDVFAAKLGLASTGSVAAIATQLLEHLAGAQADFTNSFRSLADLTRKGDARLGLPGDWLSAWRAEGPDVALIARSNPALIPRNHRVEQAIASAVDGDFAPFERLTQALALPFDAPGDFADLADPPAPGEAVTQTFCGT